MTGIARHKPLIMVGVIILLALSVWWVRLYAPLHERIEAVSGDLELLRPKRERLEQRLAKLRAKSENSKTVDVLSRFSELIVDGSSPEEVNANTQALIQEFVRDHAISIKTYKELPPSKWRQHSLSRVQFHFKTNLRGLSDLLEYLENLKKVVRVENLTVSYQRSKDASLSVSLRLDTFCMEAVEK